MGEGFNIPSLPVIVISAVAFLVAISFIKNQLNSSGAAGGLLALAVALLVSMSAGTVVDWVSKQVNSPQASTVKKYTP